ncbi:hypothetical protein OH76DRAFT_1405391 [Lentinus brumalis]|uniref:BTB domain-containing protein n=1 Tax=Lentinus brumalis TaxID=2498619 RepID=A0A371D5M7_9APHY|nr:hypothetical protein OH76DRAFT_1405391 [Polyporus brumalis]
MAESYPTRAPFDDEDADIIFRSADGVDFRLHKVIVSKLSPILRDMLAAPPPPDVEGVPILDVTEDARTLEHVFRLCYPVEHPDITTVDDLQAVLQVACKYDMAAVAANVRRIAKRILPREPLRVYALAYMLEIEDAARDAALLLRDEPYFYMPISPPPEFTLLPAVAVYAVHVYLRKCMDAALRVLDDTDWILNDDHTRGMMPLPTTTPNAGPGGEQDAPPSWPWVWMVPTTINGSDAHAPWCTVGPTLLRVLPSGAMYPTRQWWCNYMWSLRNALHMRPSGQTVRGHLATCADILHQAASCAACMPGVYADLTLFNTLLAAKIDQAVAQVQLDLPFGKAQNAPGETGRT